MKLPLFAILCALSASSVSAADPAVSIDDLASRLGAVIIIDTRSHAEWDVIRVPTARCLPGHTITEGDLLDLRPREQESPQIIFVGATGGDASVREAAARASKWSFKSIAVLSGGMSEWAEKQPSKTLLFGLPMDSPEAKRSAAMKPDGPILVAKDAFLEAAKSRKFTVLDVRAPGQRVRRGLLPAPSIQLTPDEFLWSLKNQSIPATRLLIADYDGSLLPSLIYFLQAYGVTEYRCLRGGLVSLMPQSASQAAAQPAATQPAAPVAAPSTSTITVPLPNWHPPR